MAFGRLSSFQSFNNNKNGGLKKPLICYLSVKCNNTLLTLTVVVGDRYQSCSPVRVKEVQSLYFAIVALVLCDEGQRVCGSLQSNTHPHHIKVVQ